MSGEKWGQAELAPIWWTAIWGYTCTPFDLNGGQKVERLMQALPVIEDFAVFEDGGEDLQSAAASNGHCSISKSRLSSPAQLMRAFA
jgi:hypothetical protein